ncbi:MAG: hypothetical protein QGF68_03980 [Nitrospinota bacterium]|nr:hypothetical protein [Nitrospinota bacterium]MDP7385716.1 hypothetical protein [Nitrospinota bacterium]
MPRFMNPLGRSADDELLATHEKAEGPTGPRGNRQFILPPQFPPFAENLRQRKIGKPESGKVLVRQ